MSTTTLPAVRQRRIRERPSTADSSNSFNPALGAVAAGPEGRGLWSGPGLEIQRQALLTLRARLRGNVAQTADATLISLLEATSASPDVADRASETVEQDLALSLMGRAAGTLHQIDAALRRIDDGSYGRCAGCETRIPAARLEAIPCALYCVACATRQERAQ